MVVPPKLSVPLVPLIEIDCCGAPETVVVPKIGDVNVQPVTSSPSLVEPEIDVLPKLTVPAKLARFIPSSVPDDDVEATDLNVPFNVPVPRLIARPVPLI